MKILITNDDGIESKGIQSLATKFKDMGEVIVVAPNKQMSCASHSMTMTSPLIVDKHFINDMFFGYAVHGTPADCVKFAVMEILKNDKPDLVLSGINFGRNTGVNIMYSGTVAGATEGYHFGIPSFAISLASNDNQLECVTAADIAFKIVKEIMMREDRSQLFLNINVPVLPKEQIKGIKVVKSSNSWWEDEFEKRISPFGAPYYWFSGNYIYDGNEEDTDDVVLDEGYVSVTPIKFNFTNEIQLEQIRNLEHLDKTAELNNEAEVFKIADAEIEKIIEAEEKSKI